MIMITFSVLLNTWIFINLTTPIMMMFVIIIQTLIICVATKILINTSWFSMLLFLIFIGGLLILFLYIVSLASNEQLINFNKYHPTNISNKTLYTKYLNYPMLFFIGSILFFYLYVSHTFIYSTMNLNMLSFEHMVHKIYSPIMPNLMLFLIYYLLIVLLVTVFIIMHKSSALRSTINKL